MPELTAAQLRSLLTNGVALPCCPLRFEIDGRVAKFDAIRFVCKTKVDERGVEKPAEIPTIVIQLTRGVG